MRKVIERETLLRELESVQPGLSTRDVIEQSSCFVFSDGEVLTYNGEIACHHKTILPKMKGAVQAEPLLAILRKLKEKKIEVKTREGEFVIRGKKKIIGIRMDAEIMLPYENLETPKKWNDLHKRFNDAISLVQQCTGKDESRFWSTCVHLHPEYIEASDNDQISRYRIKTGVRKSVLVRGASIKHILSLGMCEFSETKTWIHFRNSSGLMLSCLRFVQDYPDLDKYYLVEGTDIKFPEGIEGSTSNAEIFTNENPDTNKVLIKLRKGRGKCQLFGEGASGRYLEFLKELEYEGKEMEFLIAPNLLSELSKRYDLAVINKDSLKVGAGRFEYVVSLSIPGEDDDEPEDQEDDDTE